MICRCCVSYLKEKLEAEGIVVLEISLGQLSIELENEETLLVTEKIIAEMGFEIIKNRDLVLVEQIKMAIIDLVHHLNNANSFIRKSDYLCEKLGMSRSNLFRKLKGLTGMTPSDLIIKIKLNHAVELFKSGQNMQIAYIAYESGFNDPKYFSTVFKKFYGTTPKEFMENQK